MDLENHKGTSISTPEAVHSEEIVGGIAQSVEQLTFNQRVQGSSPCALTNPSATRGNYTH